MKKKYYFHCLIYKAKQNTGKGELGPGLQIFNQILLKGIWDTETSDSVTDTGHHSRWFMVDINTFPILNVSGEKCIAVNRKWFTPTEFERFAGKTSFKNWKLSIRCMDVPLGKLIQVCWKGIFILEYTWNKTEAWKSFYFLFFEFHCRKVTWNQVATKKGVKR